MKVWGIIGLLLLASVKFLVAPLAGISADLNYLESVSGMIAGGILGILVFYFSAHFFMEKSRKKRLRKTLEAIQNGDQAPAIFTKKNKRIVKLKHRLGYYGVVFIALPFVSIPVEGILCAKFYKHKKNLMPLLIFSIVIWSFALTAFYYFVLKQIT